MAEAEWAAASARTLARRLRRKWRQELGQPRAAALVIRTRALREALTAHWQLSDLVGCHFPTFGDSLSAASLLGNKTNMADMKEAQLLGNWARHAPPPGMRQPPTTPVQAISASELEAKLLGEEAAHHDHTQEGLKNHLGIANNFIDGEHGCRQTGPETVDSNGVGIAAQQMDKAVEVVMTSADEVLEAEKCGIAVQESEADLKEGEADLDQCPKCNMQMEQKWPNRKKGEIYDCDVCGRRRTDLQRRHGDSHCLLLCEACDYAVCGKCCIEAAKRDEQFLLLLNRYGFGEHTERELKVLGLLASDS